MRKEAIYDLYIPGAVTLGAFGGGCGAGAGYPRANAYTLMYSKDFPTITIGKRMIVPKDKLLVWMDERMSA